MRVRRIQKKQDASTISHHKRSLLNYKIGLSENRLPMGPCLQGLSCLSSPSPAQGCRCRSTISRKRRRSRQRAGPWSMWKKLNTQVLFGNVFLWTDGHNFQTFTEEELPPQVCSRKMHWQHIIVIQTNMEVVEWGFRDGGTFAVGSKH